MSPTINGAGSPFAEGLKKLQGTARSHEPVLVSSSRLSEFVMSLPLDGWRCVKEHTIPYTLTFSSCTWRLSRFVYTYEVFAEEQRAETMHEGPAGRELKKKKKHA